METNKKQLALPLERRTLGSKFYNAIWAYGYAICTVRYLPVGQAYHEADKRDARIMLNLTKRTEHKNILLAFFREKQRGPKGIAHA